MRADVLKRLEILRHRFARAIAFSPKSPRAKAPRFDEDSFDKVIRKLSVITVLLTASLLLETTSAQIDGLRPDQVSPGDRSLIAIIKGLFDWGQWPLILIIFLAAADCAAFVAWRLYGTFGWDKVLSWMATFLLLPVILSMAVTLMSLAKLMSGIIDKLPTP